MISAIVVGDVLVLVCKNSGTLELVSFPVLKPAIEAPFCITLFFIYVFNF